MEQTELEEGGCLTGSDSYGTGNRDFPYRLIAAGSSRRGAGIKEVHLVVFDGDWK